MAIGSRPTAMNRIYLDHNATSPVDPQVAKAMAGALHHRYANPASQHTDGRRARRVLDDARSKLAAMLGARLDAGDPDQLIFTSGATEANNLAIFGLAGGKPAHAIISAIEHPSVFETADALARRGWKIDHLPVNRHGIVRIDVLPDLIGPQTRFVSIMLANHETGVSQGVAEAADICRPLGISLHTDAVQAAGKTDVDFRQLGVDAMTVSAHKLRGSVGIGAFLLRENVALAPWIFGGHQQLGLRPGTESVVLAIGMLRAYELWRAERSARSRQMALLRDRFESLLTTAYPESVVHGRGAPRLPHVTCISFPGLDRQALQMALDLSGVACSTGSACSSGSSERSRVLSAMGLEARYLDSGLRFSLGPETTLEEVDEACCRIAGICNNLRSQRTVSKMVFGGRFDGHDPI